MDHSSEGCNEKTTIDKDRQVDLPGEPRLFRSLPGAIGIYSLMERYCGSVRESAKGIRVKEAFKQLICFFLNGTNSYLTYLTNWHKR